MDSTVEKLVNQVSSISEDERDLVRKNVEFLDGIDDRFSSRAAGLFVGPRTLGNVYARTMLRQHLADHLELPSATRKAKSLNDLYGLDYTAATVVLEVGTIADSIGTMAWPQPYSTSMMLRAAVEGDLRLLKAKITALRPDVFIASTSEANGYFRSVAVAANVATEEHQFLDETPSFIIWAAGQDKLDDMLSLALRVPTINPETLRALTDMQATTPAPLHEGLI